MELNNKWVKINLGKSATLKARIGWQGLTTAEYLSSGDYFLVGGTDFSNGFIDWKNCVYVKKERYDQDKYIQLQVDDILVTKDGTIGKVAIIDKIIKPTTLNSGVFVIRPKKDSFYPKYLFYILRSNYFSDFLSKLTAGSTINHLYQKDFVHYTFPAPSTIEEQKQIANTLSDTDQLIQNLKTLITKKKAIKQGAMQKLLTGKKRLKGFTEKWETKKLGDIFEISAGGDLDKESYSKTRSKTYCFPIYSNSHSKKGLYGYSKWFNYDGHFITISARGGIGFTVYRNEKFNAIGRLLVLKPVMEVSCKFLEEYINLKVAFSNESTSVPQLTAPQVSKYFVSFPSIQEQHAIAQIFNDMDDEIAAFEKQLKKTKALKQGMMQELLTGKTRLVKPTIQGKEKQMAMVAEPKETYKK